MRKFLEKLIAAKEKRAAELRAAMKQAETADEVRALGDTLQAVLDELQEAKDKLAEAEKEEKPAEPEAPANEEERSANPMHSFRKVAEYKGEKRSTDRTDSVEYRTAFMNFVCRGVAIPMELRDNEVTTTTDASAVIPTTLLHEIVKEMKGYGEIFARVRHLNVQGGVSIPVITLLPTASWVAEGSASESKKLQANESVIFNYYGLECKIAQTLLASIVTLDVFQQQFAVVAAEALVQAIEVAIFKGTGVGQPLGITVDTRVPAANKVSLDMAAEGAWGNWKKTVFAKMKKAYRNGTFVMAQSTFDGYIDGMVDANGQPIARVNYGVDGAEVYRFGGKEVITVESDILPDYDTAATGDVVAVFVNLPSYAINSNLQMQTVKWTDHDTNEVKTKVIMVLDGKLVDPNGVILVKKA